MNLPSIVNKIYFLTKTNSSDFDSADMLFLINNAMERVSSLIMTADGRWQWDDTNQTDLPIAVATITSGQQDYSLDTTHLAISNVEIKDTAGNWTTLTPVDAKDLEHAPSATDFMENGGTPVYYDKIGVSLMLYPTPNYTQTASLKVRFQRGPVAFETADLSDTTSVPGFNSLYHDLIPLWVAYEYAISNAQPIATAYMNEIVRKEEALVADYQMRDLDDKPRLRVRTVSPR